MAVSDVNKAGLIHKPTILRGLVQVLVLFLDDAPPIPYRGADDERDTTGFVGGGGQDKESVEYAIEALHQLSFFYEDDSHLRKQYMAIDGNILPLLQRLATHPNLSEYARRGARYLCNRLNIITAARPPPNYSIDTTTTVLSTDTTTKANKRIVISYARTKNNKELVESLQNSLSFLDFDVWRDELECSDTNEAMVQAIESSHTVVVCVSPEYYTSAICRQEAQHIHTTLKKKKGNLLRVIYVMTDRSYSHSVDGWLKAMMGDSPRYPLWDSQYVSKTAMSIARRTLLSVETSPSVVLTAPPILSPVVELDSSLLSTAGLQSNLLSIVPSISSIYDEAWALFTDPSKAVDYEKLKSFLSEVGLTTADELDYCDSDMWEDLAAQLKPIPKRVLSRILAKKPTSQE